MNGWDDASTAVPSRHRSPSPWNIVLLALGLQGAWWWLAGFAQPSANRHLGFGHPAGPGQGRVMLLGLATVVGLAVFGRRAGSPWARCVCILSALMTTAWCLHTLTIGCEGCRSAG